MDINKQQHIKTNNENSQDTTCNDKEINCLLPKCKGKRRTSCLYPKGVRKAEDAFESKTHKSDIEKYLYSTYKIECFSSYTKECAEADPLDSKMKRIHEEVKRLEQELHETKKLIATKKKRIALASMLLSDHNETTN